MKKLILSLFAIATVFVACNKESIDSADPIAAEIEDVQVGVTDVDIDALIERLSSFDTSSLSSKGFASSARSTAPCVADARVAPTGASNYISYEVFLNGSDLRAVLRSEDSPALASFRALATVFLVHTTGNDFNVVLNGNVVSSGSSVGLIGLMRAPEFIAVENLNANGLYTGRGTTAASGLDCTAAPAASWTSDAAGLVWTHPTHGSYTLSEAPFPLSGWLATTSEVGHLNYAGTASNTVRIAIEANLEN